VKPPTGKDIAMRTLATLSALALFGLTQPATAQMMCAPGQQAQASSPSSGGMMCTSMNMVADDPLADKPSQTQKQAGGMCGCCKNMAMMRSGQGGGMNMPGMEPPKQQ
jgi:hypothetical protein